MALGGSNSSLFLRGSVIAGQGFITGQGSAALLLPTLGHIPGSDGRPRLARTRLDAAGLIAVLTALNMLNIRTVARIIPMGAVTALLAQLAGLLPMWSGHVDGSG